MSITCTLIPIFKWLAVVLLLVWLLVHTCYNVYLVLCYDAKVNFDDNAKFRQQKIFEMEDESELDPREVIAAQHHLNYIGMDGNIGCLGTSSIW